MACGKRPRWPRAAACHPALRRPRLKPCAVFPTPAQPGKERAGARQKVPLCVPCMACGKRPRWPRAAAFHPASERPRLVPRRILCTCAAGKGARHVRDRQISCPELSASALPDKGRAGARLKIPRRTSCMACGKRPQWPCAAAFHPALRRPRLKPCAVFPTPAQPGKERAGARQKVPLCVPCMACGKRPRWPRAAAFHPASERPRLVPRRILCTCAAGKGARHVRDRQISCPELSASAQPGKERAGARLKISRRASCMMCGKRPKWPCAAACHPASGRPR